MDLSRLTDDDLRERLRHLGVLVTCVEGYDEIRGVYEERDLIHAEQERRWVPWSAEDKWTCAECGTEYPDGPFEEQPYGPKIITDETGWQSVGGHICKSCALPQDSLALSVLSQLNGGRQ